MPDYASADSVVYQSFKQSCTFTSNAVHNPVVSLQVHLSCRHYNDVLHVPPRQLWATNTHTFIHSSLHYNPLLTSCSQPGRPDTRFPLQLYEKLMASRQACSKTYISFSKKILQNPQMKEFNFWAFQPTSW